MHRGWIKLYRCLLDDPIWQVSTNEQKVILITLLLMANHREKKWQWQGKPYICRPGEMITSLAGIQAKCGNHISIRNIRTALNRFEKMGFLTNQSTPHSRLITVCHWEDYQNTLEPDDTPDDSRPPTFRQSPDSRLTPNKNDKNDEKGKKRKRPLPLSFEQIDIQHAEAATAAAAGAFLTESQ